MFQGTGLSVSESMRFRRSLKPGCFRELSPSTATYLRVVVPGGKSRAAKRTLYLTQEVVAILSARLKTEGPWLFPSERYPGNHITKLSNSHDRACREAGVSFVLYDLRHTFGTRQGTELKTDPFTLAAIMGHANLRTIMRYVHPDQAQQKQAMERYDAAMRRRKMRRVK